MVRLSSVAVVLAALLSSAGISAGSTEGQDFSPGRTAGTEVPALLSCDPGILNRESYRLATDAQPLNVTRPRTNWWDGFDASLRTHQDALGDLNDAALAIAESALALDARNQLARSARTHRVAEAEARCGVVAA